MVRRCAGTSSDGSEIEERFQIYIVMVLFFIMILMGDDGEPEVLGHTGAVRAVVFKHNTCLIIFICKKTWAQIEFVCLAPPVNASEQHDFRGVRPAAAFMVQ